MTYLPFIALPLGYILGRIAPRLERRIGYGGLMLVYSAVVVALGAAVLWGAGC